jgi:hypothetical protein
VLCTKENTVPVKLEAGGGAGDEGSFRRGDVVGNVTEYIHPTVVALHASCKPQTFIYTERSLPCPLRQVVIRPGKEYCWWRHSIDPYYTDTSNLELTQYSLSFSLYQGLQTDDFYVG